MRVLKMQVHELLPDFLLQEAATNVHAELRQGLMVECVNNVTTLCYVRSRSDTKPICHLRP